MSLGIYRIAATIGMALLVSGCQTKSGPATYPVAGTVTYQGKPLESGRIIFVPDATQIGSGPTCAYEIADGKFAGESTAGVKKVEIYGSWETGETIAMDDGTGRTPKRASIPSKYNEGSKVEIEVLPQTNESLTFDLQ